MKCCRTCHFLRIWLSLLLFIINCCAFGSFLEILIVLIIILCSFCRLNGTAVFFDLCIFVFNFFMKLFFWIFHGERVHRFSWFNIMLARYGPFIWLFFFCGFRLIVFSCLKTMMPSEKLEPQGLQWPQEVSGAWNLWFLVYLSWKNWFYFHVILIVGWMCFLGAYIYFEPKWWALAPQCHPSFCADGGWFWFKLIFIWFLWNWGGRCFR